MLTALKCVSVLCVVLLAASCSETDSINAPEADADILFAPLENRRDEESVIGYWSLDHGRGLDDIGLFFFYESLWMERSTPNMELLIIEFLTDNQWQASLLYDDWNGDLHLQYPYLIGEYMFKDNGQFMMSGGRMGCFSSIVGRYFVRGDTMVLRANGGHVGLDRYSPLTDPRVRDRLRVNQ